MVLLFTSNLALIDCIELQTKKNNGVEKKISQLKRNSYSSSSNYSNGNCYYYDVRCNDGTCSRDINICGTAIVWQGKYKGRNFTNIISVAE